MIVRRKERSLLGSEIFFMFLEMYVYWEESESARSDCNIHTLSWMGSIPDSLQRESVYKLSKSSYYRHGWLATGNANGIIGITYTACEGQQGSTSSKDTLEDGCFRRNYNLRGHRNEVSFEDSNNIFTYVSM